MPQRIVDFARNHLASANHFVDGVFEGWQSFFLSLKRFFVELGELSKGSYGILQVDHFFNYRILKVFSVVTSSSFGQSLLSFIVLG